jgi:hypothetical protein
MRDLSIGTALAALAALALPAAAAAGCSESEIELIDEAEITAALEEARAPPGARFIRHPSLAAAVSALILSHRPRVVGFGEYHQSAGGPPVMSSLARFRDQVLPAIAGASSELVVETWVEGAECSPATKQVTAEVKERIQRPAAVESEILTLLAAARDLGLDRHVLEMSCAEIAALRSPATTDVDFERLLGLITERLLAAASRALAGAPDGGGAVLVYGGSMHNDLFPYEGLEDYSYAARLAEATGGRFLEIDVFVPELIADSKLFAREPWFDVAHREARPDAVLVFERGPRSYVVIAPTEVAGSDAPEPGR